MEDEVAGIFGNKVDIFIVMERSVPGVTVAAVIRPPTSGRKSVQNSQVRAFHIATTFNECKSSGQQAPVSAQFVGHVAKI
jgi:hypothetical protein